MQTDRQIDAIRERQDARAIDLYFGKELEFVQDHLDAERAKCAADRRLQLAIELEDIKECLTAGTLDYMAAAGVVTEYIDDLLGMARK